MDNPFTESAAHTVSQSRASHQSKPVDDLENDGEIPDYYQGQEGKEETSMKESVKQYYSKVFASLDKFLYFWFLSFYVTSIYISEI